MQFVPMNRKKLIAFLLLICCLLAWQQIRAQQLSRVVKLLPITDEIFLDSAVIYTPSIFFSSSGLLSDTVIVEKDAYHLDLNQNKFHWLVLPKDTLYIVFRIFPFKQSQKIFDFQLQPNIVGFDHELARQKFQIDNANPSELFGGTSMHKSGSLARGIGFGNNQSLGLNSALNLQLTGQIADNLTLTASLSDANIPFQASGTTNQIREFDQVFIQIHNDQLKVTAGDFWLDKPESQFLTYRKRAQGLSGQYTWQAAKNGKWYAQNSIGLSKGKFQRQIIQGLEAVQGPYRLTGANNEPYILILAATERIYLDGHLLQRGQEFDYVIDYANAELIFTSRHLITKDSRIVAEFQYADQNYARSLLQHQTRFENSKLKTSFAFYQEQDLKNQALQQVLSPTQKLQLSQIGDTLSQAFIVGYDSTAFLENTNMYRLIDTLGFENVLVFSVDEQVAFYKSVFTEVGMNQGDYILAGVTASGNFYKWVAPVNGMPQGNFAPFRKVQTPQRNQLATAAMSIALSPRITFFTENAISENDLNLFSNLDDKNNVGLATKGGFQYLYEKKTDSLRLSSATTLEYMLVGQRFVPIEQFRTVEFDRDWNIRNKNYSGNQNQIELRQTFAHSAYGVANIKAQYFAIDQVFLGQRLYSDGNWAQKGWAARWDASALKAHTLQNDNIFIRHRLNLSKQLGRFKLGWIDDHEFNKHIGSNQGISYQFYDAQAYIALQTLKKFDLKVYYRERYDWRPDSLLALAAKATTSGLELKWNPIIEQNLTIILGSRQLDIVDSLLIDQKSESSLVSRFDYNARFFKNALMINTFYELGSGLEQKRRFQYIKVNDGQGIYTWIDYNADGVKDLNEFEVSIYADQANYIRVFVPSANYAPVYSNEWNQSIVWRPELLWSKREGALRILSKFSTQTRIRVQRKLQDATTAQWVNPFLINIDAFGLQSANAQFSNTLLFNKNSKLFNAEYNFLKQENKILLANGYDAKALLKHQINLRIYLSEKMAFETTLLSGSSTALADYTTGRNYQISQQEIKPQLIFQEGSKLRISMTGAYSIKQNDNLYGGQIANSKTLEAAWKVNQSEKGSFNGNFKYAYYNFSGNILSAAAYEMLDGLKPGTNWTWQFSFQKIVGKNLQLSLNYSGRKMPNSKFIHVGGMELRATF